MSTGIVCEFNPFHNGHRHLICEAKSITNDDIVCVMSGNFVQRGEYACQDKFMRAKWAKMAGADLILENPYPFCAATAEYFAKSALKILAKGGMCDKIAFGAENDKKEDFLQLAKILLDKNIQNEINNVLKQEKNIGYAAARERIVFEKYGERLSKLIATPNNLLGVEYTKAIIEHRFEMDICPIKRVGAEHDGNPSGDFSSATYIRQTQNYSDFCPEYVTNDFSLNGMFFIDFEKYYPAIRSAVLFFAEKELKQIADMPWDYVSKIKKSAKTYDDFDGFFNSLKSKHMTDARLRRILIFLITKTKKENFSQLPDSSYVLDFSESGAKIIRQVKKKGEFFLMSKISDMKKISDFDAQNFEKQLLAEKTFSNFCKIIY